MIDMRNIIVLKKRIFLAVLVCFITIGTVSVIGCARDTKATTTTVTTLHDDRTADGTNRTSVTTEKDVESEMRPRGVIGGLFYTIGQVLIFPFRVIGSLFT
jgi:hypothetical protein